MSKKKPGGRDYLHLSEIMHGTGGAHKSVKDKMRSRNGRYAEKRREKIKEYLGDSASSGFSDW